jgi:hypothetical protein
MQSKNFCLRLPPVQYAQLAAQARQDGRSVADVVRAHLQHKNSPEGVSEVLQRIDVRLLNIELAIGRSGK